MSHKRSVGDWSGDFTGHGRVAILRNMQVILHNTFTTGACIVVLKDECTPMPTGVGHNNRLNDIVSGIEPGDVPLADVEFCPPSHDDPSPNHDTPTFMGEVVCDRG